MISVFALLGQYLFAGRFVFDENDKHVAACGPGQWDTQACKDVCPDITKPGVDECRRRLNFDTFPWAFTTIFVILSGEDWIWVMYDGMLVGGWHMCFYFVGVVCFGNFLILNLFIAILMSSFESQSEKNRIIER